MRELFASINGGVGVYYSDSTISDLVNGRKNLGAADAENARFGSREEIAERFRNEIEPLLDENKVSLAVAAVRELALIDGDIGPLSVVDRVDGLTKSELERTLCFDPWAFLAGALIFVASEVRNRGAEQDCASVGELFTERLDEVAASLVLGEGQDRKSRRSRCEWMDGPSSLTVIKGDLFELASSGGEALGKGIAVVPVDSGFSTEISRRLEDVDKHGISENTLHGKWLLKLMSDGMPREELERRIDAVLVKQGFTGDEVPIGTVSVIDLGTTAYYLLAVSRMDENGNAQSSPASVTRALESLVDFYDKHGQGYPLYVPLVGTGLSRAHMSVGESLETIRDVFTANRRRIHGNVSIVVLPGAWDELGVDGNGKGE